MRFMVRSVLLFLLAATFAAAQQTLPLWPAKSGGIAEASIETDTTKSGDQLISGRRVMRISGVTNPTLTFYAAPRSQNSRAGIIVFPGGGYRILAYDLEGTEVCQWANSIGLNCAVLKYRVPNSGPYPEHSEDLADAQRAIRLARQHAAEWNIDPARLGVLGFSAGAHLAVALGNHPQEKAYQPVDAADQLSPAPSFVALIYPGILRRNDGSATLRSEAVPSVRTPPTFLVQAEDDPVHVENSLLYYQALKDAGVKAEMHLFAEGGHGYGLRKSNLPVTNWPALVQAWLRTIGVLPPGV